MQSASKTNIVDVPQPETLEHWPVADPNYAVAITDQKGSQFKRQNSSLEHPLSQVQSHSETWLTKFPSQIASNTVQIRRLKNKK